MERGYYSYKSHKKQHYPDSLRESKIVLNRMKKPDKEYFLLTDESPRKAFTNYMDDKGLDYDPNKLKQIIKDSHPMIIGIKEYYNRPRPSQVNSDIVPHVSSTAQTPAYPSGHAFQSYLLAKYLSREHPLHTFKFYSIANRIANSRVSVGLHYPSDNRKAFQMAHSL